MKDLKTLVRRLEALKRDLDLQEAEQIKVKFSDEYVALGKQIEELMQKQDELLPPVNKEEYNEVLREVMEAMKNEQVYQVGNVTAKFREKKEVNTSKVLHAIGGDMDIYISLSNITQVALKDFAKNSPIKKDLMDCIETVSKEITDVVVKLPKSE